MSIHSPRKAQSLIELLVAIALGAFFVIAVSAVIAPSLRENTQAANVQVGSALGKELLDNVRVWSERDWHGMLSLATGSINTYYLNTSSSPFQVMTAASATYPNGYAYRRTITIQGSKVSQVNGTDLANFPVLVSLSGYADLAASSTGGAIQSVTGNDIQFFSDASGTSPLYAEQESYSSSTGAALYWVQVSSLTKNVDTPIYVFYGNSSPPASPGYFKNQVWDGNYKGVYHLASVTTVTPDSTGNGNNGSVSGATAAPATTTMQIDGAAKFVAGSSQYVSMPINLAGATQTTAEFWLYQSSYIANAIAAGFTPAGNMTVGGFDITPSNGSGKLEIWATGNAATNDNIYTRLATGWHHYVFTENLTVASNQINLYIDGSSYVAGLVRNKNGNNTNVLVNNTFYMMTLGGSSYFDTGIQDELRISSNIRSADWINTEYRNESNPGSFCLVGAAATPNNSSNLTETLSVGSTTYSRYFYVTDVYRSSTGTIVASGGTYDPSTKQVVVKYSWPNSGGTLSTYLTRSQNFIFNQTDWSGGSGQNGPATSTNNRFASSSNIDYSTTTGSFYLSIPGY
jgi:hypothetical protein